MKLAGKSSSQAATLRRRLAPNRHHVQELRDRDDCVRGLRHFHLPEDQPLPRREGRDHMNGRLYEWETVGISAIM
jgi:hypothetical protein